MTADRGDFVLAAAAEGLGVTLQPTFIAGEAIRGAELVPMLRDFQWPASPACALYPPARQLSARVRACIDYFAGHFAGTPYTDNDCENC